MTSAKEFVEFWLENSVRADDRLGGKQDQLAVDRLADRLITPAGQLGFTPKQMPDALGGDISAFIRTSIDAQNASERARRTGT